MSEPREYEDAHREIGGMTPTEMEQAWIASGENFRGIASGTQQECLEAIIRRNTRQLMDRYDADLIEVGTSSFVRGFIVGVAMGASLGFLLTIAALIWGMQ